jgi:predicted adenine nucleotide alpha hydrolase (AANH) superfamily ATPase
MKTAVEWLVEQIERDSDIIFYDRNLHPYQEYIEQAKEMEKGQIMKTWYDCKLSIIERNPTDAEQYYNETFKSE